MFIISSLKTGNFYLKRSFLFLFIILFLSNLTFAQHSHLEKGIELREKGDLDESLKILKQAEKQDKNNTDVLYQIALTYIKKNEIEDRMAASDYLERALRLQPANANYLMEYALLKKRQGYVTATEETLKRIMSLYPDNISKKKERLF